MTNQAQHGNDGTSETSAELKATKKTTAKPQPHLDSQDQVRLEVLSDELWFRKFSAQVEHARSMGTGWVETTMDVIKHFNPSGLGKSGFFLYRGIKVCEVGKSEQLQKELDMPHYAKSGLNQAKIEGSH